MKFLLLLLFLYVFVVSSINPSDIKPDAKGYHGVKHTWLRSGLSISPEEKKQQMNTIASHLDKLYFELLQEEAKLLEYKLQRDAIRGRKLLWFLDAETRELVHEAEMMLNDQERVVENVSEDIDKEWRKLKPLVGIFSRMFFLEVVWPFLYLFQAMADLVSGLISFGIILSIFLFWPVASVFFMLWTAMGVTMLPIIAIVGLACIDIYLALDLPFIMINYSPSVVEFIGVYTGIVTGLLLVTFFFVRLFLPDVLVKLKRE